MRIRCAVESDSEAIIALWRDVFPEYDDPTRPQRDPRASIVRKLSFGDGLFWLAERDRVIGTAMAGYDGHRGWIYSIGVTPTLRRQGYARALLTHAEGQLRMRVRGARTRCPLDDPASPRGCESSLRSRGHRRASPS